MMGVDIIEPNMPPLLMGELPPVHLFLDTELAVARTCAKVGNLFFEFGKVLCGQRCAGSAPRDRAGCPRQCHSDRSSRR